MFLELCSLQVLKSPVSFIDPPFSLKRLLSARVEIKTMGGFIDPHVTVQLSRKKKRKTSVDRLVLSSKAKKA